MKLKAPLKPNIRFEGEPVSRKRRERETVRSIEALDELAIASTPF
jgi:hypothetical protein